MNIRKIYVLVFLMLFLAVSGLSAEDSKRPEEISHIGTVTYTKTAGKYTYIHIQLDENGKEVWLATMPIKVSVGDKVEYTGGLLMKDFHSTAMNKTFDSILLITRIRVLNGNSPTEQQDIPDGEYHKNIQKKKNAVSIPKSGEIAKAENGKTIKEIYPGREELKDKEVILRAKVMKISRNILGKNWITLSDGTGAPPDNEIVAVTSEDANINDILTIKGILRTDVNIGADYKYKVLIENAEFIK